MLKQDLRKFALFGLLTAGILCLPGCESSQETSAASPKFPAGTGLRPGTAGFELRDGDRVAFLGDTLI